MSEQRISRDKLIETIELLAEGDGINREDSLALARGWLAADDALKQIGNLTVTSTWAEINAVQQMARAAMLPRVSNV